MKMGEKKVKVLGISGSPRGERSRSERMLREVLAHAESYGAETEIIRTYKKNIPFCDGCYSETKRGEECTFPCPTSDNSSDTAEVMKKIIEADALAISSPVYWGAPSASLMNLIQKLTSVENNAEEIEEVGGKDPLNGKVVAFIFSYDMDGVAKAFGDLAWPLSNMGCIILPYTVFIPANIDDSGEMVQAFLKLIGRNKFIWVKNLIRLTGRNLALLPRQLEGFELDDGLVEDQRY